MIETCARLEDSTSNASCDASSLARFAINKKKEMRGRTMAGVTSRKRVHADQADSSLVNESAKESRLILAGASR